MLKSILWEGFFILPWGPSYETLPRRQDSRATRARRTSRLVLSRLSRSWCFTGSALWLDVQQPQQSWWMYLQPRGNTASVTQCALLTISKTHKNNMTLHVTRAGTFVTSQPEQNGRQQPAVQNSRHEMWRAAAELKTEGGGRTGPCPPLSQSSDSTPAGGTLGTRGWIWNSSQSHALQYLASGKILLLLQTPFVLWRCDIVYTHREPHLGHNRTSKKT